MDKETARYIVNYFPNLLTDKERLARRHAIYSEKMGDVNGNETKLELFKKRALLREDKEALDLLSEGYDSFELSVANRILKEVSDKIFFNNCGKCGKLARTPYARQCRNCGHEWHSLNVAQFKLNSSVQITGRHFYLLGEVTKGEVKIGQYIDLTMLGLANKPKIESIEFALKRRDGEAREDIGLGTTELADSEKEYLINVGSFGTPFDIIKERR